MRADPPPMTESLRRAGGLRPAQAGIAFFGAARPAFVAATLVDLAQRGYLGIAETGDGDWVLTRFTPPPADGAAAGLWVADGGLLRYEKILLRGLFQRQSQARLSGLASTSRGAQAVARMYDELGRLAIRRGWLDDKHDGADDLLAALQAFRAYLRRFQPPPDDPWLAYREYLPYAIMFGLTRQWDERFAGLEPGPALLPRIVPEGGEDLSLTAFSAAASSHVSSVSDFSASGDHGAAGHGGQHETYGDHHVGGHHDFGGIHHSGGLDGGHH
jgi:hypothetical protein